jgi:hypothetical protein
VITGVTSSLIVATFSVPVVGIPRLIGALAREWLSKQKADA